MQNDLYIRLWHGRMAVDEQLDDWGFDGPVIGPFLYAHITYMDGVKVAMEREAFIKAFPELDASVHSTGHTPGDTRQWVEHHFMTRGDLFEFQGRLYGDISVIPASLVEEVRRIHPAEDPAP